MENHKELQEKANLVRKWCLRSTTAAGSGHPTSCLSAADLTTVLFDKYFNYDLNNPLNLHNDRFVLSKGHAAPLLYTLFGMAGAYPLEETLSLRKFDSRFEGHPTPKFIYAEASTGSLGQGLSVGAGLALLAKREHIDNKTFILLGDGELAEGQVWEAANFAGYHRLDNLIAIADINRLAQSGPTMFGHDLEKYADRFRAFGFEVIEIDGHNLQAIDDAFQQAMSKQQGKPVAIIAETIKGKGISFLEDKEGWHGKTLDEAQLEKALAELGAIDDELRFHLKAPTTTLLPVHSNGIASINLPFNKEETYPTREVFGLAITELGKDHKNIYVLDADVKNSTFTLDFLNAFSERFVECFIAEQNMVSVAVGLSRLGKIPVVATFAAFLTRAADQIRMARVSEANIKFVGSHVGVSIGEDGPSQMGLEDIALFGTLPNTVIFQPAEAVSTAKLTALMVDHHGMVYMRTLRSKTPLLYDDQEVFEIGGSKLLRQSSEDQLTIAATGVTVFEALKAADQLKEEGIYVRVLDCYCICPIDKTTLLNCIAETLYPILITVEDHFAHGGMGDFATAAVTSSERTLQVKKMAVSHISRSGKMEELLEDAGISASAIVNMVRSSIPVPITP
ncbi:transketolase [Pedobacter gandavensis]|uniref:Transketolase n=1 Tax=Pedobacter gandavensis TaxID=2679963 RepID=A0ABR6EPW0_9SPHI|nr:transketolase [Pedobacter gandavensis]MBB2147288.1 transketolase [Pedobacter gandavensis]